METAYFDLFDDELWEVSKGRREKEGPLLDTIRFKIVLALVSGKTLVVPEQWAISSPSFISIAAELLEPFFEDRKAGKMPRLPFIIGFGDFRDHDPKSNPYRSALVDRLRDARRRLKFSDAVDVDQTEDAGPLRAKIASVIADADPYDSSLSERLNDLIQNRASVAGIVQLLRYCEIPGTSKTYQDAQYQGNLGAHLLRVKQFVLHDTEWTLEAREKDDPDNIVPVSDSDFSVISEFKDFFNSPEAENNPGAYVMLMQRARERYSVEGATFIEIMGRVGMHAALGNCLGAHVSSHIHGKFKSQPSTMPLTEFFCDSLFTDHGVDAEPILSKESIFDAEQAKKIDWRDAWTSVQSVAADSRWQELLHRQNDRITAAGYMSDDGADKMLHDCMLENIDYLNTQLRQIRFADRPSLRQLGGAFYITSATGLASAALTSGVEMKRVLEANDVSVQLESGVTAFGIALGVTSSIKLGRQILKNSAPSDARITNISSR